jgi:hypothetical protein
VEGKKHKPLVTFSWDIGMQEVGDYSERGLVGRFGCRVMVARDIHGWVTENWGLYWVTYRGVHPYERVVLLLVQIVVG